MSPSGPKPAPRSLWLHEPGTSHVGRVGDGEDGLRNGAEPPGRRSFGEIRTIGLVGFSRTPSDAVAPGMGPVLLRLARRVLPVLGLVVVALVGGYLGARLVPPTTAQVGPLTTEVTIVPSLHPGVSVLLPPAGEVRFRAFAAPLAVNVRITQVDLASARAMIEAPDALAQLEAQAPAELRAAALRAAAATLGGALAGAAALALAVYRRSFRRAASVVALVLGVLAATSGLAVGTFDADRFAQPQFSGLLSRAPYLTGNARSIAARLQSYRSGLADLVSGVTTLYAATDSLSLGQVGPADDVTVVLHVSDIHLNPLAFDLIDRLVKQFRVDLVVDTGDITTWGTDVEAGTVARIGRVGVPYVYVRGNHDSLRTQAAVARNRNAVVLDGQVKTVAGLTLAGIGDPVFTPDNPIEAAQPSASAGAGAAPPSPLPPQASVAGDAPGADTTVVGEDNAGDDPQGAANLRLAEAVRGYDTGHAAAPVQVALVHEPYELEPLLGRVPLVLAGHTHRRSVRDPVNGTRVMVEGSTGGAGLTAAGLQRLGQGEPLPMSASLLYFAKAGPDRGRLLAYDDVTVGGYGLASVSLQRHVIRSEQVPDLTPSPVPTPSEPLPSLPVPPPAPAPAGAASPFTRVS